LQLLAPKEQNAFHQARLSLSAADERLEQEKRLAEERRARVAQAALQAARLATSMDAAELQGKVAVKVKEMYAGKEVEVVKMVDLAERDQMLNKQKRAAQGGLEAMVAALNKKSKVNVIQKSRLDWDTYKRDNVQEAEELEAFKKSGTRYTEKQNFLKSTELRQYEKERDQRLASDIRTRGRT